MGSLLNTGLIVRSKRARSLILVAAPSTGTGALGRSAGEDAAAPRRQHPRPL